MIRLDRTPRSARTIAALLVCLASISVPAGAIACGGRPVARHAARMVMAGSPSPNEDEAAKSSTQKAPQANGGNASSTTSQGSASAGAASQQKQ